MHQRSLSKLLGVTTQQGALTPRTTQDRALWSTRARKKSGCCCPPRGAPLWAWLLLGALVVPGAWSFLSEEEEELLVELHNHYRGQVSPSASVMMPLKWDPSLKVIAEGYAAKCIWNHNPELEDTGENLFAGTGPLDLRVALEKWFLEHLDYDYQNNSCDEDKMCGHYTQMVWADTHRVGCAFHLCNNMEGLDWERVSFLVCNYFPAGNYEEMRPYVEGDWCSRCPENLQKCENNLCVADTVEEDEVEEDEATSVYPTLKPDEFTVHATNDAPAHPDTTASTPSIITTLFAQGSEDTPLHTSAETTEPPEVPAATPEKEEKTEQKTENKEEDVKEKVEEKEEERGETADKKKAERERDITQTIPNRNNIDKGAGSVSSPSVLLVCLTGILTLRL